MHTIDEGENFRLMLHEDIAVFQVWARPDVSFDEGARYAGIAMNTLRMLLGDDEMPLVGIVFDVSLAPGAVGPTTHAQIRDVIQSWTIVGRNVALYVGDKNDDLYVQLSQLSEEVNADKAHVSRDDRVCYRFAQHGER